MKKKSTRTATASEGLPPPYSRNTPHHYATRCRGESSLVTPFADEFSKTQLVAYRNNLASLMYPGLPSPTDDRNSDAEIRALRQQMSQMQTQLQSLQELVSTVSTTQSSMQGLLQTISSEIRRMFALLNPGMSSSMSSLSLTHPGDSNCIKCSTQCSLEWPCRVFSGLCVMLAKIKRYIAQIPLTMVNHYAH